jgi:hypothetical protein
MSRWHGLIGGNFPLQICNGVVFAALVAVTVDL